MDWQAVPPTMTKTFLLWSVHTNLSALTKRSLFSQCLRRKTEREAAGGDATRKEETAERVGQRTAVRITSVAPGTRILENGEAGS